MSLLRRLLFQYLYLGNPRWDTGISPRELLEFIHQNPPGRALDLGCGTGTNALTLAQNGWQVTGVDFVGHAIRAARRKASQAGRRIDFRQGDVTRMKDLPAPFDLILDIGCFHSLTPSGRVAYAQNLAGWLAPQGTYLLYAIFKGSNTGSRGLVEADLQLLATRLRLVRRQDGVDRPGRASAWFTYQRKSFYQ